MERSNGTNCRTLAPAKRQAACNSVRLACHFVVFALYVLTLLALVSCSSISDDDLVIAGGLILRHELEANYGGGVGRYYRQLPWQNTPASAGMLDDEQMPDWASSLYVACVYWEDEFRSESTIAQPGPDIVQVRQGTGRGWVLLTADLGFHILEANLRWTTSEDGVETESVNRTFINAWDDPGSEN